MSEANDRDTLQWLRRENMRLEEQLTRLRKQRDAAEKQSLARIDKVQELADENARLRAQVEGWVEQPGEEVAERAV